MNSDYQMREYTQQYEYEVARVVASTRLVRYGCPVKRCKVTRWAVVEDRTRSMSRYPWQAAPPERIANRTYCTDRGHGNRKNPVMVEVEALELAPDGRTWLCAAPRPRLED